MAETQRISTGIEDIDRILDGLRIGDNVVWKVDEIADYKDFVQPFVATALAQQKQLVYMRFGNHQPLVAPQAGIRIYELDAYCGFESFATRVHHIITDEGPGVFYIFDCLTDLLSAWATDNMIGNFFRVTCPYLYELETVAYFAFRRETLFFKSVGRILKTTQVMLNLPHEQQQLYFHPIKVWQRYSPTMFLPHVQQGETFVPVANSFDATNLMRRRSYDTPVRHLDHWHQLFLQAEELVREGADHQAQQQMVTALCRQIISRDERVLDLARRYFSLEGLLKIKSRIIGTGYIGGKAVGMLLARKILQLDENYDWNPHLEHQSDAGSVLRVPFLPGFGRGEYLLSGSVSGTGTGSLQ